MNPTRPPANESALRQPLNRASLTSALGFVLLACSKTPRPSGPPIDPSARSAPSATPAQTSSPWTKSDAAPSLPDGCWNGLEPDAAAESLLATLVERCAPAQRAVLPGPKHVELAEGESSELAVMVDDPTRCLRALAVGGPGIVDLELMLIDARDRALGRDELEAPFALVGARGPVCADAPGIHRLRVRVGRGHGRVDFGIFRPE